MKDVSSVQDIKLRASYGIVGSQAISPYATMGLMSATAYNFGTNSNFTGYWANDIATPELRGRRPSSSTWVWSSPCSTGG